jgi:hypothetical protein
MHIHQLSRQAVTELSDILGLRITDVVPDYGGYWHLELEDGVTIPLEPADLTDPDSLSEWRDLGVFGYSGFTEGERLNVLSLLPLLP